MSFMSMQDYLQHVTQVFSKSRNCRWSISVLASIPSSILISSIPRAIVYRVRWNQEPRYDNRNDKNPLSYIIYIWASALVFHRSFLFGENESSRFNRPGIKFGTIIIRQAYSNILVQSLNNIWLHNLYISASSPSWINMEVNFSCSNIPLHVLGCLSKSQKRDQSSPWKC